MSIDRCACGTAVDTDSEPDAYEYGPCLCMSCRDREESFRERLREEIAASPPK